MKTLAEDQGKKTFDWNRFLKNAIRRKTPVEWEQVEEVERLSGDWVTCACGNQCSIIPRNFDDPVLGKGEPKDDELRELGVEFYENIISENWVGAKETLKAIEVRSAYLINEEMKASMDVLTKLGYTISKKP